MSVLKKTDTRGIFSTVFRKEDNVRGFLFVCCPAKQIPSENASTLNVKNLLSRGRVLLE